ncbi:hypothetical protein [Streptomyces sp. NPDC056361]|uniref:hypothetical protein n=1 Tax=Streptomyces sp. NPDC056361 TaxID=3345795 RepID=UPI0035DADE38
MTSPALTSCDCDCDCDCDCHYDYVDGEFADRADDHAPQVVRLVPDGSRERQPFPPRRRPRENQPARRRRSRIPMSPYGTPTPPLRRRTLLGAAAGTALAAAGALAPATAEAAGFGWSDDGTQYVLDTGAGLVLCLDLLP